MSPICTYAESYQPIKWQLSNVIKSINLASRWAPPPSAITSFVDGGWRHIGVLPL